MVDPNLPAIQVMDLFGEKAGQAGIRLNVDLQPDLAPAPLDADAIHDCLSNLVSNAIDACMVADQSREFVVTLSTREESGVLIYEVVDNGLGMAYEISKKVFSKFFTTKGSDRGTGLGLLTTKRMVHQHGGRISFSSSEGEGSTFRIELPRESLPTPEPAVGPETEGAHPLPEKEMES
jgi:signal transduction histidine kinase